MNRPLLEPSDLHGFTAEVEQPRPIYAEHGVCYLGEPTTFLFSKPQGDFCREGWIKGHVPDGTVLPRDVNGVRVIVLRAVDVRKVA